MKVSKDSNPVSDVIGGLVLAGVIIGVLLVLAVTGFSWAIWRVLH